MPNLRGTNSIRFKKEKEGMIENNISNNISNNSEENKGLGAARLTGFNTSTGEFIMHVDSDDYIPKNAVEVLVNKQTLSGADIIEGSYQKFIDDKTLFVEYPFNGSKEDRIRRIILQYNISNNIWAKIIRKSIYTEHDIFNIEGIHLVCFLHVATRSHNAKLLQRSLAGRGELLCHLHHLLTLFPFVEHFNCNWG